MIRITVTVLALGLAFTALAQPKSPADASMEVEMMRQQLARAHAARDQVERDLGAALIKMQNENEAQKATLIEWLRAAQAGVKQETKP